MNTERIIQSRLLDLDGSCDRLNEGQRVLLDLVLGKLQNARNSLGVETQPTDNLPEVNRPVRMQYPDRSNFQPNYTVNSVLLGGCTE
jgi:hypothetical protein